MDNVTHACAGALMAAGTVALLQRRMPVSPTLYRTAMFVGLATAELPDADLVYSGDVLGMGKLGYLLHHRGHTHTVLFALVAGIVVWALAAALVREARHGPGRTALLSLSLAGTLSHIALDWTNNYGVHPWWPLDNRWFYGDAMFIVEPWLWIVSLVPLVYLVRRVATRVLVGLLLLVILGASLGTGMVRTPVAVVLTVAAGVLLLAHARLTHTRRLLVALIGWVVVEGVFFAASYGGRTEVRQRLGGELRDVVLTPGPGDPFCLRGLLLLTRGDVYEIASVTVAPWPAVHSVDSCNATARTELDGQVMRRESARSIRWQSRWVATISELRALAGESCEIAAALRFIRLPAWRPSGPDSVVFYDTRYGEGGFASIVAARRPSSCPRFVPSWRMPRADLLASP